MDNLSPKLDVSVIIAAYNVENYIERAIRSALDQTGVTVEVIVVDDGSTDRTVATAAAINDARVKIIKLNGNSGPSAARNTGLAAATTPWVAILDGDDAFAPGRLAQCLKCANDRHASIVVDNIEIHREADGKIYPMFPPDEFGHQPFLDLATFIRGNLFLIGKGALGYLKPVFSTIFLRQHNLAYDPAIRIGEDYMLMAEALASGGTCAIEPSMGYRYTVRAGSISHRLTQSDIQLIIEGDRKFLSRYKLDPAAEKAQKLRSFSIREIEKFTELVDALKKRDIRAALYVALTRPTAVLHLWRPIAARLQRLLPKRER